MCFSLWEENSTYKRLKGHKPRKVYAFLSSLRSRCGLPRELRNSRQEFCGAPPRILPCLRRGDRCAPVSATAISYAQKQSKQTDKESVSFFFFCRRTALKTCLRDAPKPRHRSRLAHCRLVFLWLHSLARLANVAAVIWGWGVGGRIWWTYYAVRTPGEPSLSPQRAAAMNVPKSGYRVFSANSSVASTELAKKITE